MDREQQGVKSVREEDRATVVALSGEVNLHHTPAIHGVLVEICERSPSTLVVNMQEVSYLDSSGIGMLVEVYRRVKSFGGRMALCCVQPEIYGLFEITKLDSLFEIYPTEAEALSA